MEKLLFLVAIFCALKANAQNYLISFTGSGESATVSTVKVENLTKGTSLTLNGSDILHLSGTTGINSIENKQSSEIKIYPNPMTDNSILQIYPSVAGNAIITVFEMTGKPLAQIQSYLENYLQEFRLSGLNSGFYLISVKGNTYQYSGKLLCNGKAGGTINIEKISNNQAIDDKTVGAGHKGTQATVDMAYTTGDRIKFTSISGNYRTVFMDVPTSSKTITFTFTGCTDSDNKNYSVVKIGTQTWMAENLNAGTMILDTTNQNNNGLAEKYCYENKESNCNVYGGLYQWGELMKYDTTPGIQGLCPAGWHIPTDAEWTALTTFLGGESIAGGKMKETGSAHWAWPNTGATNESGFTALPGGYSYYSGTLFMTDYAIFWSSSQSSSSDAWYRHLQFDYEYVIKRSYTKKNGYSIRCLKN